MSSPPPRNGYFYTEREELMRQEHLRSGWQRASILGACLCGFAGGFGGSMASVCAFIALVGYNILTHIAYGLFGINWDDEKAMMRIAWLALIGGVLTTLSTTAALGPLNLLGLPAYGLWAFLLRRIAAWMRQPSQRQIQDWQAQNQPVPRIRE